MRAKVLHADGARTIALVFEAGDEPMQGLLDFAKRERLTAGHFTAIGRFGQVVVSATTCRGADRVRAA
jgi:predicted DNA-binding protein with PD1-like motif